MEIGTEPEDDNEAPVVSILQPTDGASFTAGSVISFEADVTDPDGWCPTMVWESSLDGTFHTEDSAGLNYCRAGLGFGWTGLSEGSHTITTRATDSNGATSSASVSVVVVSAPSTWSEISTGIWHACGISSTQAYCWGYGSDGQLGDGGYDDHRVPAPIASSATFASVATGFDHSCGLSGSTLYCWGDGDHGQIGSTGDVVPSPEQVPGNWNQVEAGYFFTCGLDTADGLYCWGSNRRGQLGNGTTASTSTPTAVSGGQSWASVAVGSSHACALTTNGEAWCWGYADAGQLGDGQTGTEDCDDDTFGNWDCTTTPVLVSGGHTWEMLTAGDAFTCGITTAGALYCWGYGDTGALGNGTRGDYSTPQPVQGDQLWRYVTAGDAHSCGITTSGSAYCWGYANAGQLGDGETRSGDGVYQVSPVPVSGGHSWSSLSAGGLFTCGVTTSSTGYCWGDDYYGQLGTSGGDSNTPVRLGT